MTMQQGSKVELIFQIKQLEKQNDELKDNEKKWKDSWISIVAEKGDLARELLVEKTTTRELLEITQTFNRMLLEK